MELTCDQLDALLSEFLDGALTPEQEQAAAAHLATCDQCRIVLNDLREVGTLYREHGRLRLPDEARARILETLDRLADDQGRPTS